MQNENAILIAWEYMSFTYRFQIKLLYEAMEKPEVFFQK